MVRKLHKRKHGKRIAPSKIWQGNCIKENVIRELHQGRYEKRCNKGIAPRKIQKRFSMIERCGKRIA